MPGPEGEEEEEEKAPEVVDLLKDASTIAKEAGAGDETPGADVGAEDIKLDNLDEAEQEQQTPRKEASVELIPSPLKSASASEQQTPRKEASVELIPSPLKSASALEEPSTPQPPAREDSRAETPPDPLPSAGAASLEAESVGALASFTPPKSVQSETAAKPPPPESGESEGLATPKVEETSVEISSPAPTSVLPPPPAFPEEAEKGPNGKQSQPPTEGSDILDSPESAPEEVQPAQPLLVDSVNLSPSVCEVEVDARWWFEKRPRMASRSFYMSMVTGMTTLKIQDRVDQPHWVEHWWNYYALNYPRWIPHLGTYDGDIWLILPLQWYFLFFVFISFLSGMSGMGNSYTPDYKGAFVCSFFAMLLTFPYVFNVRPTNGIFGVFQRESPLFERRMVDFYLALGAVLLTVVAFSTQAACIADMEGGVTEMSGSCQVTLFDKATCNSDKCSRRAGSSFNFCSKASVKGKCMTGWLLVFIMFSIAILRILAFLYMVSAAARNQPTGESIKPEMGTGKREGCTMVTFHGPKSYGFPISALLSDEEAKRIRDQFTTIRSEMQQPSLDQCRLASSYASFPQGVPGQGFLSYTWPFGRLSNPVVW